MLLVLNLVSFHFLENLFFILKKIKNLKKDKFLKFRDRAVSLGIKIPIIPGILPIDNFEKVKNFSSKCGTTIPNWIEKEFAGLETDSEIQKIVGASIACDLVKKLHAEGIDEFHFYTLNKYELSYAVLCAVGVRC